MPAVTSAGIDHTRLEADMTLTTRVISWSLLGIDSTVIAGTITIQPTVTQLVDVTNNVVYLQNTLTYPISAGMSAAVVTTDNANTNPAAGNWGYTVIVQTTPGVPDIMVDNVQIPSGSGSFNLATVFNTDGL
jgi:hypothetical protein